MTSRNGSSIGYTSYDLPSVINAGSNSSTLSYGAFRNRFKQVSVTAGGSETTIYVGGILERVTKSSTTTWRHKVQGPGGLVAIVNCTGSSCNPTATTNYIHSDHLGSGELITSSSGTEVVKLSFGAFGERRDRDWSGPICWQMRRCWLRALRNASKSMADVMLSILFNRESQLVTASHDRQASRWKAELRRARSAYVTLVLRMAIGCPFFWRRLG